MAADHVPAHDLVASGPSAPPALPSPLPRTPTMRSTSSGRTQISISIQTMARFKCPRCQAPHSGLHTFRFSRRNSFRNPLHCTKCNYTVIQLGGSRSSPSITMPTIYTGHGSDEAEPSTTRIRPFNMPNNEYKPSISSGLASATNIVRPFAMSEVNSDSHNGMDIDVEPTAGPTETDAPEISFHGHAVSGLTSNEKRVPLRRQKKATIFLHRRLQAFLDKLPHGLRTKLLPLAAPLERIASQPNETSDLRIRKGKEPMRAITESYDVESSLPNPRRRHSSPSPRDHHCDCTGGCHCSNGYVSEQLGRREPINHIERFYQRNNAPVHSEHSLMSAARPPRPESLNLSQLFFDIKVDMRDRFNRFSRGSSDGYTSRLSLFSNPERSMSCAPERDSHLAPPQHPHPTAAQGHAAANHQPASVHDSVIQMSTPRSSQALTDG
jgi:hypothetical protein